MSTRASRRALVVASVIAAATACSDPVEPALPEFEVTARQWSGGAITIRSAYFIDRDPLPILVVGDDTLALTRQDDSTLVANLPRGPSETVTVRLARGSQRDDVATVERVGYRQKRTVTPALHGELLATHAGVNPLVFGGTFTGTAIREPIVRLDVVPGVSQVLTLRQTSDTRYGTSPGFIPGTFTVRDSTDSLRLAALLVDPPTIIDPMTWAGTGFTRHVSLISLDRWLVTSSHMTFTRTDSTVTPLVNTESPWTVFISPRGDRTTLATYIAQIGDMGVPVWDNATGEVAYRLPLRFTESVAFTPDGGILFAAGGQDFTSDTLVAVEAAAGTMVTPKVRLPDGFNAFALAYRPAAGGQLLVAAASSTTMALLVYRALTLELLGILPAPDNCGPAPATGECFQGIVTVDGAQSKAYIVIPGDPTPIWTFDLWPGP